jgi:hypothetical protein
MTTTTNNNNVARNKLWHDRKFENKDTASDPALKLILHLYNIKSDSSSFDYFSAIFTD